MRPIYKRLICASESFVDMDCTLKKAFSAFYMCHQKRTGDTNTHDHNAEQ